MLVACTLCIRMFNEGHNIGWSRGLNGLNGVKAYMTCSFTLSDVSSFVVMMRPSVPCYAELHVACLVGVDR